MTENKISLDEMMSMPIGGIAKLSPKQLSGLLHDATELLNHAKKTRQWVEAAIAMKYEEQIRAKRQRMGKDTGIIHLEDDGFKLTTDIPKKPVWDQNKLVQIIADIQKQGDDPSEYVTVTTDYKVPESKYNAWPKSIQKVFDPARILKTGKPTYSLTPIKEAA